MNHIEAEVINHLSKLIMDDLNRMQQERAFPSSDPDRMDDRIKFYGTRANCLRVLRGQFEDLMSEAV